MIPPRSILAATDFSEASRVAVTFAACLAKRCHATFHLLHAEEPLLTAAAHRAGVDLHAETREALQHFVASAVPAIDYAPLHHVVSGPAADVIVETARSQGADLIVVGSRGMSGAERLVFGSTAEGVLRRAHTSVLVVPPEWKPANPTTPDLSRVGPIVVGIDFSAASIDAASAACGLASVLGTGIEAVHVVPELRVLDRWRSHAVEAVGERMETARAHLNAAMDNARCGVPYRTHVESGRVAECLAALAGSTDTRRPMLALGRRAGSRGAPPGAIAYRVLNLASVPVLVCVPPEVSDAQR